MMHRILCSGIILAPLMAAAQCGPCAADQACTVDPPFPTACPLDPPPGVVGVPYDLNVTFWVPPLFQEPNTGLNVVLSQVTLQSLEDMPLGLTYQASSPDLTYHPQSDPFGCVRICGVPMAATTDSIRMIALAQGTVGGLPISREYTINIPIHVLPASADTVPDFGFGPDSVCAPATVAFAETAGAACAPGMDCSFIWDFGNGAGYQGLGPPPQEYAQGGLYPVVLERAFSVPMITQIAVSGVSSAWCGDLDEPNLPIFGCSGQPDLYCTLTDARKVVHRTTVKSNTQSATWSGLSIPLGFPPFTLRVYDKDDLSADDLLGTFTIASSAGSAPFSQGGTQGQVQVQVQTVLTTEFTDTVTVFDAPPLSIELAPDSLLVCASPSDLASYAWTLNGAIVPGAGGPCAPASNGTWSVAGTTAQGCTSAATQFIGGLGIAEAGAPWPLRIWPNPARDLVRIALPWPGPATVEVLDPGGRAVLRRNGPVPDGDGMIDLDAGRLGAGLYVVRCEAGGVRAAAILTVLPR